MEDKLLYAPKNGFDRISDAERAEMTAYCRRYMDFMDAAKTEREAAAATFLKWLTEPENNVRFVTSVGYMPVTEAAFELLPDALAQLTNPKYRSLYEAFVQTQADYEFYTPPQFADYLTLEQTFEAAARSEMAAAREAGLTADEAFDALRRAVAGA